MFVSGPQTPTNQAAQEKKEDFQKAYDSFDFFKTTFFCVLITTCFLTFENSVVIVIKDDS